MLLGIIYSRLHSSNEFFENIMVITSEQANLDYHAGNYFANKDSKNVMQKLLFTRNGLIINVLQ